MYIYIYIYSIQALAEPPAAYVRACAVSLRGVPALQQIHATTYECQQKRLGHMTSSTYDQKIGRCAEVWSLDRPSVFLYARS